ncbi:MAG: acetyltransferase [Myxococcota bacterium]
MSERIAIVGTGGFAREVFCALCDLGRREDVVAFHEPDDNYRKRDLLGVPVRPQSEFDEGKCQAFVGIGNPATRQKVVAELPLRTAFATLVHPSATVSEWVELGPGTIVCAGSILTCQIKLGAHCHVNLNVTVGHDCTFGDYCTVAPGANISGNVVFGDRVDVGTQASFRQGVRVCDDAVIGMGAVVVKDIAQPGTYVGLPAKKAGR